jgi:hypothetical protein
MDQKKLEKIIRPIVEGQIRGFLKEHPSIVAAVDWYKPRKSKDQTFVNSLAKRIIKDLLCDNTTARLGVVFLERTAETSPKITDGSAPVDESGALGTPN